MLPCRRKQFSSGVACIPIVAAMAIAVLSAVLASDPADGEANHHGSGLKYVDLKVGDGKEATEGSTVYVFYTGRLKNGTQVRRQLR